MSSQVRPVSELESELATLTLDYKKQMKIFTSLPSDLETDKTFATVVSDHYEKSTALKKEIENATKLETAWSKCAGSRLRDDLSAKRR